MILKNINHDFEYHTTKIATMFFPLEKIETKGASDIEVVCEKQGNTLTVSAKVYSKSLTKSRTTDGSFDIAKELSLLMFDVLSEVIGFKPPWGILYGVRPARLMHSKAEQLGEAAAKEEFLSSLVEPEKVELALEVMHRENAIIAQSTPKSFSLYISIPFCPTRCAYCSFVSHSIENAGELIDKYVELLCLEISKTAEIAKTLDLKLESVYFGGGTPTTLSAAQLRRVIGAVRDGFDVRKDTEFTVEAGRPDTVDKEKLEALWSLGVNRISINPQTFNDEVREKAGRRHTTEQTVNAFELAKKVGFDNINMDFIAGLAGESLDSFKSGIKKAVSLGAESITVHNLALKSAAFLVTENELFNPDDKNTAAKMVDFAYSYLKADGYNPYYMYRQSKSLGNLENVGYAKEGKECRYNIYMMDETHSVLSCGAGAVTKLKKDSYNNIQRVYNYKYPYEYISDFDEVLRRKDKITGYYQNT
ncbi:MAG: coproporphyrinogen dehydrogenase HemZ [Eubacterium sp.]|nr:coproporphyrinogen dehydrogenase HemZ [Eubacterium sp.]